MDIVNIVKMILWLAAAAAIALFATKYVGKAVARTGL